MKLINARDHRRTEFSFILHVEDVPSFFITGWGNDTFMVKPDEVRGIWFIEAIPELRYVVVCGEVVTTLSDTRLSQEYSLYEDGVVDVGRPLAPEWVFEALKEAGVEY